MIREGTSQHRDTINTDPSTCSPQPMVGIINKPVPEHHKVQTGLEAKKGSNPVNEDPASDMFQAEKRGPNSHQRWHLTPNPGHKGLSYVLFQGLETSFNKQEIQVQPCPSHQCFLKNVSSPVISGRELVRGS